MAIMILPKGSIVSLSGNDLTEHNRGDISVDIERIENMKRMHDGTMRKIVLADKYKWSLSWSNVPNVDISTVDGKWGGKSIEAFYKATPGVFVLTVKESGVSTNYNAFITNFGKTVVKRGANLELWNMQLEMEEA